jgi:hypothetical protein
VDNLTSDILALKILVFALFTVFVLWLLALLLRQDSKPEAGLEIYTVKDGRVQIHKLKDWREVQKSAD